MLVDGSNGEICAAFEALAASRATGEPLSPYFPSRDHCLRTYHFVYKPSFAQQYHFSFDDAYRQPIKKFEKLYEGPDAIERWRAAASTVPRLNALNLDYPCWGGIFTCWIPGCQRPNSNSGYRTLIDEMGLPLYTFKGFYWYIGIDTPMAAGEAHQDAENNDRVAPSFIA